MRRLVSDLCVHRDRETERQTHTQREREREREREIKVGFLPGEERTAPHCTAQAALKRAAPARGLERREGGR